MKLCKPVKVTDKLRSCVKMLRYKALILLAVSLYGSPGQLYVNVKAGQRFTKQVNV